jgi:transposase-like protein
VKKYVNLLGEEYEPMIPGTKCPVSAGVLEEWYWGEGMSQQDIANRLAADFYCVVSCGMVGTYMRKGGVRTRSRSDAASKWMKIKGHPIESTELKEKLIAATRERLKTAEGIAQTHRGLKKAIIASANSRKSQRPEYKCHVCKKSFTVQKSARRCALKYCSKKCSSPANSPRPKIIKNMFCLRCSAQSLCSRGAASGFIRFYCTECNRYSIRPIIELGLRQDLEAAGALDDGRILASAFSQEAGL